MTSSVIIAVSFIVIIGCLSVHFPLNVTPI